MTKRNQKKIAKIRQRDALNSVRISRIVFPIIIGLGVIGVLYYRQYDQVSFSSIDWKGPATFGLVMAIVFLTGRIIFYAARLYVLSDRYFTFLKCIQLIFIWEFSSAVSPTNVGGSAVALFVISQEKIGAARTATIVIYTIVLDTLFFLLCVPIWFFTFGSNILGPGRSSFAGYGGWEITLIIAYIIMLLYGSFFFYGLFYKPQSLKRLSLWISRIKWLRTYRAKIEQLGDDITMTSKTLFQKSWSYHMGAFLLTMGAWSCRFFLIISLIFGLAQTLPLEFGSIMELYARIQTMFIMMAVSPTPGGAGLAELLFGSLLADFVPTSLSLIIATIWRTMAYYFFLLVGAVVIPQWIEKVIKDRKSKRIAESAKLTNE